MQTKPNPIKDICYVACVVSVIGWGFSYIGFRFDSFNLVPPGGAGGWGVGAGIASLAIFDCVYVHTVCPGPPPVPCACEGETIN